MAATVTICERNGATPGHVTENINNINWKNIDDTTTSYINYRSAISLGANSFTKYNYIRFSGTFSTLGNVKVTHIAGTLPNGIKLMSSPSIVIDSAKLSYAQPTTSKNTNITATDLSALNSSVNLLVGPQLSNPDPAAATGKINIADNNHGSLYTNYFVTQLQTSISATTGPIGDVTLQITYDEI